MEYASWDGSTWGIETADSTAEAWRQYTSLALDSSGNPHISYELNELSVCHLGWFFMEHRDCR